MSKLQAFLMENANIDQITEEVPVSARFRDEEGSLLKFKVKAMTGKEYTTYQKQAISYNNKKGKSEFDNAAYYEQIIINHTLDPNFKDAESIKAASVQTPEQFLNRSLLAGEIDTLAGEILRISGFNTDMEELRKEAKN